MNQRLNILQSIKAVTIVAAQSQASSGSIRDAAQAISEIFRQQAPTGAG
jgi:hypothetical protein